MTLHVHVQCAKHVIGGLAWVPRGATVCVMRIAIFAVTMQSSAVGSGSCGRSMHCSWAVLVQLLYRFVMRTLDLWQVVAPTPTLPSPARASL